MEPPVKAMMVQEALALGIRAVEAVEAVPVQPNQPMEESAITAQFWAQDTTGVVEEAEPERIVLVYSSDEVERWRESRNHVVGRALREGRVLYERS